jgi:hypothetical protein
MNQSITDNFLELSGLTPTLETMQHLGFRPYTITNGRVTIWITKHPAPNPLNTHQSITTDHATAVLSTPEAGENALTTFWRLLGWHRVDNGFRRDSWFMRADDAKKQFDAARKAAKVGE